MFSSAILLTLMAVVASGVIWLVKHLNLQVLKGKIQERMKKIKERLGTLKKHKVAFADTRAVLSEAMQEKIENNEAMSWDAFEKLCDDSPYMIASYDGEQKELMDLEPVKPEEVDEQVVSLLNSQKERGLLLVGA